MVVLSLTCCGPARQVEEIPSKAPQKKLVMTHFMHQVSIGAESKPGEGSMNRNPSLPNGVMAMHLPESLQNYRNPLAAARQDIALAENGGVDTFLMLLSPTHLPGSQFASVIRAYWQTALEQNGSLKMAVDIWPFEPTPENIEKLKNALALLKSEYGGAWRRYRGRLVVFLYHKISPQYFQSNALKVEQLNEIFADIGGREAVSLVLYNPVLLKKENPDLFAQADAFTDWPHSCYAQAREVVEKGSACASAAGKEYWYPAMPSFAQSRRSLSTPNVREKLGAINYIEDWERAISADSPVVVLQTWNDLTEDSAVMPETNHGYAYYDLTRLLSQWYREGREPEIKKEQIFLFHHPQARNVILPAGRKPVKAFSWEMKPPPTDYVNVVTALKEPAHVSVMFGEKVIAQKDCEAGIQNWLIYHPAPLSFPEYYPKPGKSLVCTILNEPFGDTEVYVKVTRNGKRIGLFRSHRPILGAAGRGEMTVVGNAFNLHVGE